MASTARDEDETREFFDSAEEVNRKVTLLAQWIQESKHTIAFTGAGISTAAGIPDFRSGIHTSLETGPGKWELEAHKQVRSSKCKTTNITKAIPTVTHMVFVKLHDEGLLKCVVSQNVDGLHRKSGLPKNALYELHGNTYLEICGTCKREYLRDFRVRTSKRVHDHLTGRVCDDPKCKGKLKDTIINFGEGLPEATLDGSFEQAKKADLCLAMGSSLTVTPAADVAETVGKRHKRLVVVNLQRTPLDPLAKLRINAKCEDVSRLLMSKLGLETPDFKLKRKIIFRCESQPSQALTKVIVQGADDEGRPFSFLKEVSFSTNEGVQRINEEPFTYLLRWTDKRQANVNVDVSFHSHYGEPPIRQTISASKGKDSRLVVDLEYTPGTHQWFTPGQPEPVPRPPDQPGPASHSPGQPSPTSRPPGKSGPASRPPGKSGPASRPPGKSGPASRPPGKSGPASRPPGKSGPASRPPRKPGKSGPAFDPAGWSGLSPKDEADMARKLELAKIAVDDLANELATL